MTIINQTNRTLLLEEINPEKLDLLTLIGDVKGIDSLSDDKIKEINQYLECRSYEEFQEKFAPCIYSFFDANTQSVRYTLKKPENIPENMLTEIPLNQSNDFLKMLFTLMESKKSQGVLNVDFGFENLLDMISPKKVMDDIRQVRKEIRYNYAKYAELEDGDPAKLDVGDKLNELFEEASNNYNNVMAMLPLAIEDIKTRLLLGAGGQQGGGNQIALGMLTMGDKGELKVLEAPKQESTALATLDDNVNTGLIAALQEDYQAINESPSDYVQSLVVRTFCPLPSTTQSKIDVPTEVANYNSYLQFYKDSKDAFIKVVKPLVEKLLGVKMFFDQYKCKTKGMIPTLLVANLKPEMLAKSSSLPTLHAYLKHGQQQEQLQGYDLVRYLPQPLHQPPGGGQAAPGTVCRQCPQGQRGCKQPGDPVHPAGCAQGLPGGDLLLLRDPGGDHFQCGGGRGNPEVHRPL